MILVEETRGGILECTHEGHIAVWGENGLIAYAGDPEFFAFYRSSSKPIQVLPAYVLGIKEKYGITDEEMSLMNGSLWCGPHQIELVKSVMEKASIDYDTFIMKPCLPMGLKYEEQCLKDGTEPSKLYHNCVGKHLGLILIQRELGGVEKDYYKLESPAQQLILEYIAKLADYPKEKIGIGIDGCGVPVFAMPLSYMAKSFMRLADTSLIEDQAIREAAERNRLIIAKHPENLMDADALCGVLCKDENIIGKVGAQGVYTFGLHDEKIGVAMKIMDGYYQYYQQVIPALLDMLGYKNKETGARILEKFPPVVKNATDSVVGEKNAVFELTWL